MDSKTSAPETLSHLSGFSSASLSYDNDKLNNDNSMKNYNLGIHNNDKTSSSSSSSASTDGGSENEGFVSGEEEFEAALEKPVVAEPDGGTLEKAAERDVADAVAPFVDSSGFPMPNSALPVENVYANNDVVGDSKAPVLKEEETFGHVDKGLKGLLDEGFVKKLEIEGVGSGEKEIFGEAGSRENVNSGEFVVSKKLEGVEEQKGEPSGVVDIEAEGMKFTDRGDSVVDAISVDTLQSGAAVVGDVERIKDNEIKELEVPVGGNVKLENGYVLINSNVEDATELKSVKEENEPGENSKLVNSVGATGVHHGEQKTDVAVLTTDDNASTDIVTTENEEKEVTQIKPEADLEAKQTEIEVGRAIDVEGHVSSAKVDAGYGDESKAAGYVAESIQTDIAYEAEHIENDRILQSINSEKSEDGMSSKSLTNDSGEVKHIINGNSNAQVSAGAEEEENHHSEEDDDIEGSGTDGETDGMIFGSSEAAQQFLEELERASGVGSHSGAESSHDHSQRFDGQIVTDSDEAETDEEGEGKELFDSAALAALLKAATGADSDGGNITITSQDGSKLFSVERPAGLGTSLHTLKPAQRPARTNLFTPSSTTPGGETQANLSEDDKKKLEKLQQLRVKFLRLVHRLGHSPEDSIVAQVLYRLALVAGRPTSPLFDLDAAKRTALLLETEGKDDLNFSLNILVLGKTGVGKSATINSIFGEEKTSIHAFEPGTTSVKEIVGTVDGVKIRVIDTPGLKSSGMEQGANRKVLSSVKKFTKKYAPDIVLYVDRLDSQTRDLNDLPLLRSVSNSLGSSIWRSAIVTLTHAASAPPDGPSGSPLSYEVFVAQRSHVVQQSIGQAVGDLRLMNPSLMNPVSLVENHPSCRKNRDGQKVLPNGQTWRPQLLLLCYSMKILSEASSLSKPQDPFDHRKLFGFRVRSPPLPYLLSWLLQSRTHPKLAGDQGGDNGDSDIDLADLSDSDQEDEEDEYDQLPPFKPLRKAQISKLSKEQKKAYFEEYDYRVKLLQKKQWREELRRMREMKKKGKVAADDYGYEGEDVDQENGSPAAVPVPLPDMVLPPSFDSDNPAFRYRFLEPTSQFLARPVLDTHGWDHDCGYDGVNLEQSLAIAGQFPAAVTVQVTKDKKEFNIHLDSSISAKHGEDGSTMAGFDIQNVGKQLAYILRGETKFKILKKNKTAAGFSVTFLGENVATGFKLEDQIALGKRIMLVGSTGTVRSQGDSAYGANLEVRLREADYPIGQDQSSLSLSLVKWRGDLALGANLQSQFSVGRNSKVSVRAGLNNKLSGQITIRTSTSDQLQIALMGIVPVLMTIYKNIRPGASENYSMY